MTGAFVFDIAGVFMNAAALWTTGAHLALAGVVTGVIAAIPGLVDFIYTVPPNSSGKKRASGTCYPWYRRWCCSHSRGGCAAMLQTSRTQ